MGISGPFGGLPVAFQSGRKSSWVWDHVCSVILGVWAGQEAAICCSLVDSVFFPDERADYSLFNYSNEFSKLVAEEYLSFFDFTGLTLDKALR